MRKSLSGEFKFTAACKDYNVPPAAVSCVLRRFYSPRSLPSPSTPHNRNASNQLGLAHYVIPLALWTRLKNRGPRRGQPNERAPLP